MSHDEVEVLAPVEDLSNEDLEAIAAGKSGGPLMNVWNVASSGMLASSRATGGGRTGFRGFLD